MIGSDPVQSGHARYSEEYYESYRERSRRSASTVVPIVLKHVRPTSVLDAGCGIGTWLRAFMDAGVRDVQGLDGSHVPPSQLLIPETAFRGVNLAQGFSVERRFDLAISM